MHLCLLIPELVDIIIRYVGEHKPTLARLARVCTVLKEPSLDALYCHIGSFGDLLHVLPWQDLITGSTTAREQELGKRTHTRRERWDTSELTRRITQQQWDMFATYAARVRHLKVDFALGTPGYSTRSVCRAFPDRCPVPTLFPNMRSVHISGGVSIYCPRFVDRLCLGPEVRAISFNYLTINMFLENISSPERFASRTPLLERFIAPIDSTASDLHSPSAVTGCICQWPNLVMLRCGALNIPCLTYLSSLRFFKHLELHLGEDTRWTETDHRFGLTKLETLKIQSSTFEKATKALVAVLSSDLHPTRQHDNLRSLSMFASSRSTTSVFTVTDALSRLVSPEALQEIVLEDCLFRGAGLADDIEWIRPLLCFSHIRKFDVFRFGQAYHPHILLGSGQLLDVVRKWPLLELIRMFALKTLLTLQEAVALIGALPHLSTFDVGIRVTHEDVATVFTSNDALPRNDCITVLLMYCAEATMSPGDEALLASILARVVPRLSAVYDARYTYRPDIHVLRSDFWTNVMTEVTSQREDVASSI